LKNPTRIAQIEVDLGRKTGFLLILVKLLHQQFIVVFQLTNGDEEAKISALLGLGCLENVELNKEALRTVAPMMTDPSTTIKVAAANALR
jgi:hypothetical protein